MASVTTFSAGIIPIPEISSFYSLENAQVPEDRPFTWTMSVSTLDGFLSFKDKDAHGPSQVAMAHIKDSGSIADWRLLNSGWAFADAIMGSGAILRSEPEMVWVPAFQDLLDFRVNSLKKSKYPINVILSGSGDLDLKHPMFHLADLQTIIVTSSPGKKRLLMEATQDQRETIEREGNLGAIGSKNTVIEEIGNNVLLTGDDLQKICSILRSKYNVRFMELTAGGIVIGSFLALKLVDEMRVTIAGQVCGDISSTGIARPHLFTAPAGYPAFSYENNPIVKYFKIGLFGFHHIFLRSMVEYRH